MSHETLFVLNPDVTVDFDGDELQYKELATGSRLGLYADGDAQLHLQMCRLEGPDKLDAAQSRRLDELVTLGVYVPSRSGIQIQYPLDLYYSMLVNTERMLPYFLALSKCVRPGSLVVELGSGLGLFALYAAKLGADVVAVEAGPVIEISRLIAATNGLESRIRFVRSAIGEYTLRERRADVVVSEFIGNSVFEEGIVEKSRIACNNYLRPGGQLIPSRIAATIIGVQSDEVRRSLKRQQAEVLEIGRLTGFDLGPYASLAKTFHRNRLIEWSKVPRHAPKLEDVIPMTEEVELVSVSLESGQDLPRTRGVVELPVIADGYIDAYWIAFRATLDRDITISNSLASRSMYSWPEIWVPAAPDRFASSRNSRLIVDWAFLPERGSNPNFIVRTR